MRAALRYVIPSVVTALSLALGLGAVFQAQLGELELAAWLIVWCVLLDVVDGALARSLHATSRFGAEFDSLADLVAFGVAPAVLAFQVVLHNGGLPGDGTEFRVLVAAAGLYTLCAAIRLARFSASGGTTPSGWFVGLPTTLAGVLLASSLILILRGGPQLVQAWRPYLPVLLLAVAAAMVSRLPVLAVRTRRNRWINALQLLGVLAAYACGILRVAPGYILAFAVVYVLAGVAASASARER